MNRLFKSICLLALGARLAGASLLQSYSPILGYEPSQGFILGAAGFLKNESSYFTLQGMGTFNQVYAGVFNAKHRAGSGVELGLDNNYSNFYDLYFGEGMQTRLEDKLRVDQLRYLGKASALWPLGPWQAGPQLEYRSRANQGPGPLEAESTLSAGVLARLDLRDNEFDATRGCYFEASAKVHPDREGAQFAQAAAELRAYQSLFGVTFAGRLSAKGSLGEPSYLYRYKLGGPDELRGLYDNRLRGKQAASAQIEARFPLYKFLSTALFSEAGEVSEGPFTGALASSAGGGLRIALPPDGLMKARIDFGAAKDQSGIYVAFGQAF